MAHMHFTIINLQAVEIPEGVTSIGSYAFSANPYWDATNGYGNQLTTVIIPSSVTNIGDYAFNRNKLTGIVIPEGVMTIGVIRILQQPVNECSHSN